MNKSIEIVFNNNKKSRLTITPTRITIKVQENSLPEFAEKIIEFCKRVSEQPEVKNTTLSLRGEVELANGTIKTALFTDNKTPMFEYGENI